MTVPMKYIVKAIIYIAAILAIAGAGIWVYERFAEKPQGGMQTDQARIEGIRQMVSLCTLEIEDEVALRDSIHGKWLLAKARLSGEVRFDLEQLQWDTRGDTLVVRRPRETVVVRESVSPGAYEVIDTWDNTLLGLGKLTTAEENALKRRLTSRYRAEIYRRGYVERARESALQTLRQLTSALPGSPVIVEASTHSPR